MASQRRALIIGGSMSGLLAGIMLRRRGWAVDIFERVEQELAGRGAGIVAQPELIARMKALGLDTRDLGVAMTTRKILDAAGRVTATIECPQVLTAWERVYRVLRDAFPPQRYHRGRGLKAFEQSGEGVVAHLSDGRHGRGRRADRRRRFALDGAPAMPARNRAALCRLCRVARAIGRKRDPASDPPRTVHGRWCFACRPASSVSAIRSPGRTTSCGAGQRRYNVVWYRPGG